MEQGEILKKIDINQDFNITQKELNDFFNNKNTKEDDIQALAVELNKQNQYLLPMIEGTLNTSHDDIVNKIKKNQELTKTDILTFKLRRYLILNKKDTDLSSKGNRTEIYADVTKINPVYKSTVFEKKTTSPLVGKNAKEATDTGPLKGLEDMIEYRKEKIAFISDVGRSLIDILEDRKNNLGPNTGKIQGQLQSAINDIDKLISNPNILSVDNILGDVVIRPDGTLSSPGKKFETAKNKLVDDMFNAFSVATTYANTRDFSLSNTAKGIVNRENIPGAQELKDFIAYMKEKLYGEYALTSQYKGLVLRKIREYGGAATSEQILGYLKGDILESKELGDIGAMRTIFQKILEVQKPKWNLMKMDSFSAEQIVQKIFGDSITDPAVREELEDYADDAIDDFKTQKEQILSKEGKQDIAKSAVVPILQQYYGGDPKDIRFETKAEKVAENISNNDSDPFGVEGLEELWKDLHNPESGVKIDIYKMVLQSQASAIQLTAENILSDKLIEGTLEAYSNSVGSVRGRNPAIELYSDILGIGAGDLSDKNIERIKFRGKEIAVSIITIAISGGIAGVATKGVMLGSSLFLRSAATSARIIKFANNIRKFYLIKKYAGMGVAVAEGLSLGTRLGIGAIDLAVEGSLFHVANTMISGVINDIPRDKTLGELENLKGYFQSIAYFGVLKTFSKLSGGLINKPMASLGSKITDPTILKNIAQGIQIPLETMSMLGTDMVINVMFGEGLKSPTREDVINTLAIVVGLKLSHGITWNLSKIQDFEAVRDMSGSTTGEIIVNRKGKEELTKDANKEMGEIEKDEFKKSNNRIETELLDNPDKYCTDLDIIKRGQEIFGRIERDKLELLTREQENKAELTHRINRFKEVLIGSHPSGRFYGIDKSTMENILKDIEYKDGFLIVEKRNEPNSRWFYSVELINLRAAKKVMAQNSDVFPPEALTDTKKWLEDNIHNEGNLGIKQYGLLSGFPRNSVENFLVLDEFRKKYAAEAKELVVLRANGELNLKKRTESKKGIIEDKYLKVIEERQRNEDLEAVIFGEQDAEQRKNLLTFQNYKIEKTSESSKIMTQLPKNFKELAEKGEILGPEKALVDAIKGLKNDGERIAVAEFLLGKTLSEAEKKIIIEAHKIVSNYSTARKLMENGFGIDKARLLMRWGMCGEIKRKISKTIDTEARMKKYEFPPGASKAESRKYYLGLDASIYVYEDFPIAYIEKIDKMGTGDALRVNPLRLRKHFPNSKTIVEESGYMWIDDMLAGDFIEKAFKENPALGAEYRDQNVLNKVFERMVKDLQRGEDPQYLFEFLSEVAKVPEETLERMMSEYNDGELAFLVVMRDLSFGEELAERLKKYGGRDFYKGFRQYFEDSEIYEKAVEKALDILSSKPDNLRNDKERFEKMEKLIDFLKKLGLDMKYTSSLAKELFDKSPFFSEEAKKLITQVYPDMPNSMEKLELLMYMGHDGGVTLFLLSKNNQITSSDMLSAFRNSDNLSSMLGGDTRIGGMTEAGRYYGHYGESSCLIKERYDVLGDIKYLDKVPSEIRNNGGYSKNVVGLETLRVLMEGVDIKNEAQVLERFALIHNTTGRVPTASKHSFMQVMDHPGAFLEYENLKRKTIDMFFPYVGIDQIYEKDIFEGLIHCSVEDMQRIRDRSDVLIKNRTEALLKELRPSPDTKIVPLKFLAPLLKQPKHFAWIREVFNEQKDISFLYDSGVIYKIVECKIENLEFIQKNFPGEITPEIFTDAEHYEIAHALRYSDPANLRFLKERFPIALTLKILEDNNIGNILAHQNSLGNLQWLKENFWKDITIEELQNEDVTSLIISADSKKLQRFKEHFGEKFTWNNTQTSIVGELVKMGERYSTPRGNEGYLLWLQNKFPQITFSELLGRGKDMRDRLDLIHKRGTGGIEKIFETIKNTDKITKENWIDILFLYAKTQVDEGVAMSTENSQIKEKIEKLFAADNPSGDANKDFLLQKMNQTLEKMLAQGKESLSRQEAMLFEAMAELGAGHLTYIETIGNFMYELNVMLNSKLTAEKNKTNIRNKTKALLDAQKKNRNQSEFNTFYYMSTEILKAAPSMYDACLDVAGQLDGKNLQYFQKEILQLYLAELTLYQNINKEGYNTREIVKSGLKKYMEDLSKNLSGTGTRASEILEKEHNDVIARIRDTFKNKLGIIKAPEHFEAEHIKKLEHYLTYLGNLAEKNPENRAILSFFLALDINGKREDFRQNKAIDPKEFMDEKNASVIEEYLEKRTKSDVLKIADYKTAEGFMEKLQASESNIMSTKVRINDALINIIDGVKDLLDPDIYQGEEKILIKYLQENNKEVGSAIAVQMQILMGKNIQLSESQQTLLENIAKDLNISLSSLEVMKSLQQKTSSLSILVKAYEKIQSENISGEIQKLYDLGKPSPEVIAIFTKLGEMFTETSGIEPLEKDVELLEDLLGKKKKLLTEEEVNIAEKYINDYKSQFDKLNTLKDKLAQDLLGSTKQVDVVVDSKKMKKTEYVPSNFANKIHGSGNETLKNRFEMLKSAFLSSEENTVEMLSKFTNDMNVVIPEIRQCLACTKGPKGDGSNNDTDLSFGDINRFFITSSAGKEKSFADELVTLFPTDKGLAFVMDRVYGTKTKDVLINHTLLLMKKLQRLGDKNINVFLTDAAMGSCGFRHEDRAAVEALLKKNFPSPFTISEAKDLEVNIVESANGDSYHEFSGAGRLKGPHKTSGWMITLEKVNTQEKRTVAYESQITDKLKNLGTDGEKFVVTLKDMGELLQNEDYAYISSMGLFAYLKNYEALPNDLDIALNRNGKSLNDLNTLLSSIQNGYTDAGKTADIVAITDQKDLKIDGYDGVIQLTKNEAIEKTNPGLSKETYYNIHEKLLQRGAIKITFRHNDKEVELFPEQDFNGITNKGSDTKKSTLVLDVGGVKIPVMDPESVRSGYVPNFITEIFDNNIENINNIDAKAKDGLRLSSLVLLGDIAGVEDLTPSGLRSFISETIKTYERIDPEKRSAFVNLCIEKSKEAMEMINNTEKYYERIKAMKLNIGGNEKIKFTQFHANLLEMKKKLAKQYALFKETDDPGQIMQIKTNARAIIDQMKTFVDNPNLEKKVNRYAFVYEKIMVEQYFIKPMEIILSSK